MADDGGDGVPAPDLGQLDALLSILNKDLTMVESSDFKGHCPSCHEPVMTSQPSLEFEKDSVKFFYHTTCFKCTKCSSKLSSDTPFYFHESSLFCTECYLDQVVGKCHVCQKTLDEDGVLKDSSGRQYHQKCFCCSECNEQLQTQYFESDGKFFCKACQEIKFLPTCSGCLEKIRPNENGEIVSVGFKDKKYHEDCLCCSQCREKLQSKYFEIEDKLFCKTCQETKFLPTCAGCEDKIRPNENGEIVSLSYKDKKYHKPCFCCYDCKSPFTDLKAYSMPDSDDLFCKTCRDNRIMNS